jgi:hypothetical protein
VSEGKYALGALTFFAVWVFVALPLVNHPVEANEFLGLGAHGWIAVATFVLAGVTLFLGLVGLQQIAAARDEAKSNRTLVVVDRYDFDPVMDRCLRRLRAAREGKGPVIRGDVVTVLNYLESIAIGISNGTYDEKVAAEHMKHILVTTYKRYLGPDAPAIVDVDPKSYIPLKDLYTKWSRD